MLQHKTALADPTTTEYKSVVIDTKILDVEQGIAEIWVSSTNVLDSTKDVIEPGAYENTLKNRNPKGVSHHDITKPVARTLEAEEVFPGDERLPEKLASLGAGGLRIKAKFNLDTQRGAEAFSDVKFYEDEQEYSIGYVVPRGGASYDEKTGIRRINTLDLFEWSPVAFGAAPGTGTDWVKAEQMKKDEETEDVKSYYGMALTGSYEELAGDVLNAASKSVRKNADGYAEVCGVGTFADRVYVLEYSWDDDTEGIIERALEMPWKRDGDLIEIGEAKEVELQFVAAAKDGTPPLELGSFVSWRDSAGVKIGLVAEIASEGDLRIDGEDDQYQHGEVRSMPCTKVHNGVLIDVYEDGADGWAATGKKALMRPQTLTLRPKPVVLSPKATPTTEMTVKVNVDADEANETLDELAEKAGRVLSAASRGQVEAAIGALTALLDTAAPVDEPKADDVHPADAVTSDDDKDETVEEPKNEPVADDKPVDPAEEPVVEAGDEKDDSPDIVPADLAALTQGLHEGHALLAE